MTKHSRPADAYHPWSTYIDAREEARRRGDRRVGTEHLILALLKERVLAQALGCDLQTARDALDAMDHDALAGVGIGAAFNAPPIPIDEPIKRSSRPTLKAVLRDRLPLTPAAKKALEEVVQRDTPSSPHPARNRCSSPSSSSSRQIPPPS